MADLAADEAIDRDLLVGELEAARFAETELREDTWNPLDWVYLVGDGLFTLNAREFAPLADRLASTAGRLEGLPGGARGGRGDAGRFRGPSGRALPDRDGAQAARRASTSSSPTRSAAAEAAAPTDPAIAAADAAPHRRCRHGPRRGRRLRAPPGARSSCRRSRGRGPAGSEAVRGQDAPHDALGDADPGPDPGRRASASSPRSGPRWSGSPASCGRSGAATRPSPTTTARSSAASSTRSPFEHPEADDLLDFCRAENARIEAFCRERDLIGLADEPLDILWTPVFLRAFGGAMLSSPGPLDKGQKAFFAITPMPDDWTEERRESNLREDNDRMLRLLTIHEAVPGHYLQGVYANRCPSLVRAIFSSGLFAEGWAVYVTQVMMDVGLRRGRPGADADPLEVLPARDHQRDHRREDPHRRDDRGRRRSS